MSIDPFKATLPVLDVHGSNVQETKEDVEQFIADLIALGRDRCIIVHGVGSGKLKDAVHSVLANNPNVNSFFVSSINNGQTLVYLSKSGENQGEIKDISTEQDIKTIKRSVELLKVKNIFARNVLGKFKYNIEFSDENKIFIIHAPNGCGKSNLLKYIRYFMNQEIDKLKKGVFEELIILCENDTGREELFKYNLIHSDNINSNIDLLPECLFVSNINQKNNNPLRYFIEEDLDKRIKVFNEIMSSFFCYEKKVTYKKTKKNTNDMLTSNYRVNTDIEYVDNNINNVPNLYTYGRKIPFKNLSSGEQFIIKLFHNLIFNLKPNGFVEIDEPEISLHPEWQELMIKKMVEVSNKYNIRILIATHSPYLLNNLDVKVGNPEYEK